MSAVGELALWAALACAAWGIVAGALAGRRVDARFAESATRAAVACAVLLALADAGLTTILLTADVRYAYAAASTSAVLPRLYRLAAFLSRPAGSVLAFSALSALLAALAPRAVRALPRASVATCSVLALAIFAMFLLGWPFAPAPALVADGAGLDPDWHLPWTTGARIALIVFASLLVNAKIRAIAGVAWRRWALAAMAVGAVALVCALRRALAGPVWSAPDWIALAAWSITVAFARPWRRPARWLSMATLVAALIAISGMLMSSASLLSLPDGTQVTARDPLGTSWTFVSDGRSIYTQLDRRVLAVFIEVGHGRGARPEWRIYIDAFGDERSQGASYAVLAGVLTYTSLGLTGPPAAGSASVAVRWDPLFGFWWLAAALCIASAIVGARAERDA